MKPVMTWGKFGLSLIDAGINSAASSLAVVLVDPDDFNVLSGGFLRLMTVAGVAFLVGSVTWLRSHRLPGVEAEPE